jgi:aminopeptidase
MPTKTQLKKYARLAVRTGANVQKGQGLMITAQTDTAPFVRLLAEEAYKAGASQVTVRWMDEHVSHSTYKHAKTDVLTEIPQYLIEQMKYFMDKGYATISVSADTPGLMADINPQKLQAAGIATNKALKFWREHMMGNRSQWCVISVPTKGWAHKVFPKERPAKAIDRLWDAILAAVRITGDNDPVAEWAQHNETLHHHNEMLNHYNFKSLHFKNGVGTDLTIDLVPNHVWAGGKEVSTKGISFNPNMPTEETFTMPHKFGVTGKVVATKPLNYNGTLVDGFWLRFEQGKVVEYDAKAGKEALENLLTLDEGSSRLGEVALLSHDSPISNSNILFYNTLFDENASCHLALGRAYPMNVKGGTSMSLEDLEAQGYNNSMAHVDFMFGSSDMAITGITQAGNAVTVFKDGNFVF